MDFASDDRARVMCWRLASDELRMFDAFLALELDERTAQHTDLFITFESDFGATRYALALRDELLAQYAREQAPLREEGLTADWTPPESPESEFDIAAWLHLCTSFATHHALPRHLVLVLRPKLVSDAAAFQQWLLRYARAAPATVRVIVLEGAGAPTSGSFVEASEGRIVARDADLDMPGAYAEISQSAGNLESPGGQFRAHFLELGVALGAQDLSRASQLGAAAIAIAGAQRWFHMMVPIHAALGGALAGAEKPEDAQAQFLAAEASALRGQTEGPLEAQEICKKLRMQSRLGLGSALITCQRYADAARVFEETLPFAVEQHDDPVRLDCYRLAAFCHERADAPVEAFRWAYDGLSAAKKIPADVLATTCLPYLGATLLGLCKPAGKDGARDEVVREIAELTGDPDWAKPFESTELPVPGA